MAKDNKTDEKQDRPVDLDRRTFLGGVGGVTVGALAGGLTGLAAGTVPASRASAEQIGPRDPIERRNEAYRIRLEAALEEKNRAVIFHQCNGDETAFPNFIGNFHKTLPHDQFGEVDPAAYQALVDALDAGDIQAIDDVPSNAFFFLPLLNPLGGLAFANEGPDLAAVEVNAPPSVASAELAAQAAEVYWMALLRDIPFREWDTNPLVQEAADDLNTFSGYTGPVDPVTGDVTPQVLFRTDYPGVLDGPIVSQLLLGSFTYDGIPITPRVRVPLPGEDFMTHFPEWLDSQNGFAQSPPPGAFAPIDPVLRFPRNPRDLGQNAGQDRVYSTYFRASLILTSFTSFTTGFRLDANYPYRAFPRQAGFSTFGTAELAELLGAATKGERHSWFQKWFVHRFLRPEAYAGLVHLTRTGVKDYPVHPDLLSSPVLDRIFDLNEQRNQERGFGSGQGTYLLPQVFRIGAPTHPSFPAGHAITAGAAVTILKAFWDEDATYPNPQKVNADGTGLEPYVPGVDGPPLTIGGELNKLAHNMSLGRDMSGVHWRVDDIEGNRQGEEVAIRLLRELKATYREPFAGWELTKFDGTQIIV